MVLISVILNIDLISRPPVCRLTLNEASSVAVDTANTVLGIDLR